MRRLRVRLVLLSFLMLFVELALIRWTGSNVVYLSYFSNFVLLGSFLGIGVGFLRARAPTDTFKWTPVGLALLVTFILVFPVQIDRSGSELIYFGSFEPSGLPAWLMLPAIFLAVSAVMAMIGEGVARTFARFESLEAYRLDLLGSIGGIVAFSLLSFAHAPPVAWGVVVGILLLVLIRPSLGKVQVMAVAAIVFALLLESLAPLTSWSPYYKITERYGTGVASEIVAINVNGVPHQAAVSVDRRREIEPIYFLPYEWAAGWQLDDVLIIGAGTGSDVAIALSQGAGRIDAVEIDPRLYDIGRQEHPDRPYDDPRVSVVVDDGRAFMQRTERRYDLILFTLPDSLTLVSGQSSLRLESYLFTEEAFRQARQLLKPDGVFALYNFFREEWLIERLAGMVHVAFDQSPCVEEVGTAGGLALIMSGQGTVSINCTPPATRLSTTGDGSTVTDDHPFLYLRDNQIPGYYLLALGLILLVSLLFVRLSAGKLGKMGSYTDLFFMGVAFLLLETMNVVRFALLFGTTWFVNSLVFAGILLAVLAAVEVARRVRLPKPGILYAALFVTLAVAWMIPQSALLSLSGPVRFVFATMLAFAPIFLANVVFAQRFKDVGSSTVAFGANLFGAMVGGVLEYGALVVGYRSLLLFAGLLYGVAFVFGHKHVPLRSVG
ncbi:MAG: spermidine synthase [Acidimicrobiia bacterium]|nr:spermidine synthase [Acidimicrobiia bacterium]